MAKTDVLHIRVEPQVKKDADRMLTQLGMSTSEAVNVFLKQVILHGGLPFEIKLPSYNNGANSTGDMNTLEIIER